MKAHIVYNSEHKSMKSGIQEKIDQIIIESNRMPEQRSTEWLKLRKTGFGGSETAALLGVNTFKKEIDLMRSKLNIGKRFTGNLYTRWGVVQEQNIQRLMEMIFHTTVEELNILRGEIEGQLYSPDGIGLLQLKCEREKITSSDEVVIERKSFKEYFYTLFEFKAPFGRIPSGKVPPEYMPQLQSGLSVISDLDNALFVNALFRICSLKDLGLNNTYNEKFHYGDKKKKYCPEPKPIALGIMVVYQNMKEKEKFEEFYDKTSDNNYGSDSDYDSDSDSDSDNELYIADSDSDDDIEDDSDDEEKKIDYNLNMLSIDRIIKLPPEYVLAKNDEAMKNIMDENYKADPNIFCQAIKQGYEMDFGNTGNSIIIRLFELMVESKDEKYVSAVKTEYSEPYLVDEHLCRIDFMYNQDIPIPDTIDVELIEKNIHKSFCKQIENIRHKLGDDKEIIGFIPWKMFDCDIILVDRDPGFNKLINVKISEAMKLLTKVDKAPPDKKDDMLKKYYAFKK